MRGKKHQAAKSQVDRNKLYKLPDAIDLVKKTSYSKFDGSIELHLVTKRSGISVQVKLPHSTGKTKKIEVADENTLAKLKEGKVEFDVLLATPDFMPKLVQFARILGPKGLMPNPKNGTLIKDVSQAKKYSADAITVKTEKDAPVVHTVAGKVSMGEKELKENIETLLDGIGKRQIVKAYIKATMGPSIKVAIA